MPFMLILIAAILIIAAFNNSQAALVTELEQDVPPFLTWALAIVGVGALGWVPGMQTISRWLLALVLVVLFLSNWQKIIDGFTSLQAQVGTVGGGGPINTTTNPASVPAGTTTTGQAAAPAAATQTASSAQAVNINATAQTPITQASPYGAFDPSNFLAEFALGFGGFGGIA